jgi:Fe-S cluster assembly iron-binding protein IscA
MGPSLGLVQDEPSEDDEVFTQEGVTYLVNKDLSEQVKPIKVDFIDTPRGGGFFIFSNLGKESGSCCC